MYTIYFNFFFLYSCYAWLLENKKERKKNILSYKIIFLCLIWRNKVRKINSKKNKMKMSKNFHILFLKKKIEENLGKVY